MKKFVKLFAIVAVLAVSLAVAAFAEPHVTYSLEPYDVETGEYDLYINLNIGNDTEKAGVFNTTIKFNTDVVAPSNVDWIEILASVTVVEGSGRNEKEVTYSFNEADRKYTDNELFLACYTTDFEKFDYTNLDMYLVPLQLAEGVKIEDLKASDIVVEQVYIATQDGEHAHHGYNDPNYGTCMTITPAIEDEVVNLTIAVAAGDVVYLQDGTVVTIAEANEAYEIPTTAGTVVVNSGFAGQKVYTVADGAVTEDTAKADGVLATNEASIRKDDTASGIRFKSTFLTSLKDSVSEYGYITTVESAKNALPADYVLDMALVNSGKAVKDVAYDSETDIFWNVDGDKTVVTAVVTGVPMNKAGVTTNVVIRPYYQVGELVVYGEPMTRTVYQVAQNIKDHDAETYAKYQAYIDEILALCEESDVIIDFGPLFK